VFCQLLALERDRDFSRFGFPFRTRQFFAVPSGKAVPGGLFITSPRKNPPTSRVVRLALFGSVLFTIAQINFESMQALAQSHFCSFEPQRHHRNAFSGFSHFT
jgi:hypothetical protein